MKFQLLVDPQCVIDDLTPDCYVAMFTKWPESEPSWHGLKMSDSLEDLSSMLRDDNVSPFVVVHTHSTYLGMVGFEVDQQYVFRSVILPRLDDVFPGEVDLDVEVISECLYLEVISECGVSTDDSDRPCSRMIF